MLRREKKKKKTKLRSSYSSLLPEVLYLTSKNTYYLGTCLVLICRDLSYWDLILGTLLNQSSKSVGQLVLCFCLSEKKEKEGNTTSQICIAGKVHSL